MLYFLLGAAWPFLMAGQEGYLPFVLEAEEWTQEEQGNHNFARKDFHKSARSIAAYETASAVVSSKVPTSAYRNLQPTVTQL